MKDSHLKVWPGAVQELANKLASGQPQELWYRDEELTFHVTSIKRTHKGHRIELTHGEVTAVIFTNNESDSVELDFFSKG